MPTRLQQPPYVLAMPTETVYGLAARIDMPEGIAAIFSVKERPFFDPLIVHVAKIEDVGRVAKDVGPAVQALMKAFWPGPLTLVLPRREDLNPMITSGLETVAVRMPRHPMALQLIQDEGVPLAAPSANKFGRVSPTTAEHVRAEFGSQVTVFDGGACEIGLESTVIRVHEMGREVEIEVLRDGSVLASDLQSQLAKLGFSVRFIKANKALAPGQMKHHYMPSIPLILLKSEVKMNDEFLKSLNEKLRSLPSEVEGVQIHRPTQMKTWKMVKLSEQPALASRELYAELRRLASEKPDVLFFKLETYHQGESWAALLDRLTKAASLIV